MGEDAGERVGQRFVSFPDGVLARETVLVDRPMSPGLASLGPTTPMVARLALSLKPGYSGLVEVTKSLGAAPQTSRW